MDEHVISNRGFLSLDFIFQKDFKDSFKGKDHGFYDLIKDLSIEQFVFAMLDYRKGREPFDLLMEEYEKARREREKK